ncbi:MAG: hypothetical protein M1823_001257 [Watsoniomyces obsoletus]|nr:MAG: hypothetical protein M1823_001257 [Watsoniomyces obsoletus]
MAAGRLLSSVKRHSMISTTSQAFSNRSSPRPSTSQSTAPSSVAPDPESLHDGDETGVSDTLFSHPEKVPTQAELDRIADLPLSGPDGEMRTFKSLYAPETHGDPADGKNKSTRTLVVFIRHFFCGNCQDYLRALSAALTPDVLNALPVPTKVVVIGCGKVEFIPMYAAATSCPWPIYSTYPTPAPSSPITHSSSPNSDPSSLRSSSTPPNPITSPSKGDARARDEDEKKQEQAGEKIYSALGMIRTLKLGKKRPRYMRVTGLLTNSVRSIWVGLRVGALQVVRGEGGDFSRVGGEFLFESRGDGGEEGQRRESGEEVVWCHRMKTTRDHTEVEDIQRVLSVKLWA